MPESLETGLRILPLPPRFLKDRSSSEVRADPTYAASHPQGCKATSRSTEKGISSEEDSPKYHSSRPTSYCATAEAGDFITHFSPLTSVILSRNL